MEAWSADDFHTIRGLCNSGVKPHEEEAWLENNVTDRDWDSVWTKKLNKGKIKWHCAKEHLQEKLETLCRKIYKNCHNKEVRKQLALAFAFENCTRSILAPEEHKVNWAAFAVQCQRYHNNRQVKTEADVRKTEMKAKPKVAAGSNEVSACDENIKTLENAVQEIGKSVLLITKNLEAVGSELKGNEKASELQKMMLEEAENSLRQATNDLATKQEEFKLNPTCELEAEIKDLEQTVQMETWHRNKVQKAMNPTSVNEQVKRKLKLEEELKVLEEEQRLLHFYINNLWKLKMDTPATFSISTIIRDKLLVEDSFYTCSACGLEFTKAYRLSLALNCQHEYHIACCSLLRGGQCIHGCPGKVPEGVFDELGFGHVAGASNSTPKKEVLIRPASEVSPLRVQRRTMVPFEDAQHLQSPIGVQSIVTDLIATAEPPPPVQEAVQEAIEEAVNTAPVVEKTTDPIVHTEAPKEVEGVIPSDEGNLAEYLQKGKGRRTKRGKLEDSKVVVQATRKRTRSSYAKDAGSSLNHDTTHIEVCSEENAESGPQVSGLPVHSVRSENPAVDTERYSGCSNVLNIDLPAKDKLIVLDLNGVLVKTFGANEHIRLEAGLTMTYTSRKKVIFRPEAVFFLKTLLQKCCVGIWSSMQLSNVEDVLQVLCPDLRDRFEFVWGQEKCVQTSFHHPNKPGCPVMMKPLGKIYESYPRFSGKTLLLDDSLYKSYLSKPWKFLRVPAFKMDVHDEVLPVLTPKIEEILQAKTEEEMKLLVKNTHRYKPWPKTDRKIMKLCLERLSGKQLQFCRFVKEELEQVYGDDACHSP